MNIRARYFCDGFSITQGYRTLHTIGHKVFLINFKTNNDKTFTLSDERYVKFYNKHKLYKFPSRLTR